MTPQSSFMAAAPLQKSRVGEVLDLLATMNTKPGVANPDNVLVPFGEFDELHFARFVVLDDQTLGDAALYGMKPAHPPIYLAFLGDFDGDYDAFIRHLTERASDGLRKIFAYCEGFSPDTDLTAWLKAHEHRPAAFYCNWAGRTVVQCREEEKLRQALRRYIDATPELAQRPARDIRENLLAFVRREIEAGELTLTPEKKTPAGVAARRVLDILTLILLIVTLPVTIIPLAIVALILRLHEIRDPQFTPRPTAAWAEGLGRLEDYDVTNQFSVMGSLKPGIFRRTVLTGVLWLTNLVARLIYTKGHLLRVQTIHFARWVFLDNKSRLFFASNYDGSLESYMDDFINKVAFGLNAVFGSGIGYPKTRWLLLGGAKDEQPFKYILRSHELPTQVWYNAVPGLTAFDLNRNSRIRRGVEAESMTDAEIRDWLALL
jgi:hypothetical protein